MLPASYTAWLPAVVYSVLETGFLYHRMGCNSAFICRLIANESDTEGREGGSTVLYFNQRLGAAPPPFLKAAGLALGATSEDCSPRIFCV